MNVVMTGAGGFVEVQGTAEGAAFTRAEMDALLRLADKGIRELVAAQREALGAVKCAMRLVLASNNAKKLAELQALFAPLALELVHAGRARHRRGRRAARHLRRERAGQGAPCGAARAAARRSPTTRACASMRSAARRACCRRTTRPSRCRPADREAQRRVQDAANNALLLERLQGVDRPARALRQRAGGAARGRRPRAADRVRPLARRDPRRAARRRRLRLRPADVHPGARARPWPS